MANSIVIAGHSFKRIPHAFRISMIRSVTTGLIQLPRVLVAARSVQGCAFTFAVVEVILVFGVSPSNVHESLVANNGWTNPMLVDQVDLGLLLSTAGSNRLTLIKEIRGSGCNPMGTRYNLTTLVFANIAGSVGSCYWRWSKVKSVGVDNSGKGWSIVNNWKVGVMGVDKWKFEGI